MRSGLDFKSAQFVQENLRSTARDYDADVLT